MNNEATRTVTIENNGLSMTILADPKLSKNEIAKGIREAIKRAVKLGLLPKAKYGCRQPYYGSIKITAMGLPFGVLSRERVVNDVTRVSDELVPWMSEEGRQVSDTLEAIGNAWNWDHSRSEEDYFHCNYYLSVEVDSAETTTMERERITAEVMAEKASTAREIERARLLAMVEADASNDTTADLGDDSFQVTFF